MNAILFVSTVLIWGTTWIAIALQVGPVPVLVSVFYRFAVAGAVLLAVLALIGKLKVPARNERFWIATQALCLYCLNFICFYAAAAFVTSGLIAVIFSLATVFNALNARLFLGEPVTPKTLVAGCMGITGVALLFGIDQAAILDKNTLKGIGLSILGTLIFSLGNIVSRRNSSSGISPITANAWGMMTGGVLLLLLITITGTQIVAPPTWIYFWSMVYLAVIGSVVGFTTYLLLIARIGSAQAAYCTVLFPIVALTISTFYEGYTWHVWNTAGLALALLGNLVMFLPPMRCAKRAGSKT